MKDKALMGARYLLGLIFVVFGSNGLMMIFTGSGFLPMPPANDQMQAVMEGLFGAVYLMPLVKLIQVVSGALLLSGKYINLAIVLLGPVVVNILGMHIFVDMGGLPMAIFIAVCWGALLNSRCEDFKPIFKA